MADLFVLFTSLTVFGVGVTILDFLGIMDHFGSSDGNGHGSDAPSSADASADSGHASADAGSHDAHHVSEHGSVLVHENRHPEKKSGVKIIGSVIGAARSLVYFSLGFGPTGLFASFLGLSKTTGLLWACGVGAVMIFLAKLLRRFIRKDLDSSIKPEELLQEKGVLLLPLEEGVISKAIVRQFGREIEIYVRCKNKGVKLEKGKEIIVEDYDNDVYWVEPANDSNLLCENK